MSFATIFSYANVTDLFEAKTKKETELLSRLF